MTIQSETPDPATALYQAAKFGHLDIVQRAIHKTPELIKGKPVVDGAWSNGGRRCCAQDDFIRCLWLLIEHGARFEECHVQTIDSAFKTFPRAATILMDHGANANASEEDGTTALHLMASIGNRFAAGILLQHGADKNAKNSEGETPLDLAVGLGLSQMAACLRGECVDGSERSQANRMVSTEAKLIIKHIGEINWYRSDRGYGYLRDTQGFGDLFFDVDSAPDEIAVPLEQGVDVQYRLSHDKYGLHATAIEIL